MPAYNLGMVEIRTFDINTASDEEARRVWELLDAVEREALPDEEPYPFAEHLAYERNRSAKSVVHEWVAEDGGQVVGSAWAEWEDVEDNRHLAWAGVTVRQDRRRQGIGTQLLANVVDVCAADGRTVIGGDARPGIPAGAAFAEAMGGELKIIGNRNALWMRDVDIAMLNDWVDRAKERAADYQLVRWDGPCPDEHVEAFVQLQNVMNTAPRDDLDMEDEIFTVERLREREAAWAKRNLAITTFVAVHQPTGEFAGYTELLFPPTWPTRAYQNDTGVDPAHRDKGLGRWLKAANLLATMDERPQVERVLTWNAGSNDPMLHINHALGFRCVEEIPSYQASADRLRAEVERRLAR